MPMLKKLSKTGSSYALIIDKSILQLLSIDPEHPVEITTNGKSLIITPVKPQPDKNGVDDPKFKKIARETLDQYSEALKELAK